jgi:hypothetical protein
VWADALNKEEVDSVPFSTRAPQEQLERPIRTHWSKIGNSDAQAPTSTRPAPVLQSRFETHGPREMQARALILALRRRGFQQPGP